VIPIIEDEYVDIEFGTGCLVTPAHDMNDKALGENTIEIIDIFNEDATMNSFGAHQGKTVLS
jgi:valyl-tRNA synthetase